MTDSIEKAKKDLIDLFEKAQEEKWRKEMFKEIGAELGNNLMALVNPPTETKLKAIHEMVRKSIDQHFFANRILPDSVRYEVRVSQKTEGIVDVEVLLPEDVSDFVLNIFMAWDEKQKAPVE